MDFGFQALDPTGKVVPLSMAKLAPGVELRKVAPQFVGVVLEVAFAGESNPEYWNDSLKRIQSRTGRKASASVTEKLDWHQKDRVEDREAFARYVIKGWRGVRWRDKPDDPWTDAPFTAEAVLEFMRKMPDWMVEKLVDWCEREANFINPIDVEEVAKN